MKQQNYIKKSFIFSIVLLVLFSFSLVGAANSTVNATNSTNSSIQGNLTANTTSAPVLSAYTQEVIGAYLNPNENYTTTNLIYDSNKYTMVLVNLNPSLILDSNNNPVSNVTLLNQLAQVYQSQANLPINLSIINQAMSNENNLNSSLTNCVTDYWQFVNDVQVCYEDTFYKFPCSMVYELDLGQALNFSYNITFARQSVDNGTGQMNASIIAINQSLENLSTDLSNTNVGGLGTDLQSLNVATENFSTGYNMFNVGHTDNVGYLPFATEGGLNRCSINTTALSNLQSVASIASQLPNQSNIVSSITSFLQTRNTSAQIKLIGVADLQAIANLNTTLNQADLLYKEKAGFSLIGLDAQMAQLQTQSNQIANQTTYAQMENLSNSINSTVIGISTSVNTAITELPSLLVAINASNQASTNITSASVRLGPSDQQAAELNSQYSQLSSQLQVVKSNIQDGNPLTSAAIANITSSFQTLSAQAQSAQPQQNQVDPVLIIEIVVILGLLVVAIFLLRKFKPQKK